MQFSLAVRSLDTYEISEKSDDKAGFDIKLSTYKNAYEFKSNPDEKSLSSQLYEVTMIFKSFGSALSPQQKHKVGKLFMKFPSPSTVSSKLYTFSTRFVRIEVHISATRVLRVLNTVLVFTKI